MAVVWQGLPQETQKRRKCKSLYLCRHVTSAERQGNNITLTLLLTKQNKMLFYEDSSFTKVSKRYYEKNS